MEGSFSGWIGVSVDRDGGEIDDIDREGESEGHDTMTWSG